MNRPGRHSLTFFGQNAAWNSFGVALAGVVAVLALVYMIAIPICTLGQPWTPLIATGHIVPDSQADLHVYVTRDEYAMIGGESVPRKEFQARISSALQSGRYTRIRLEVDRRVKYESLLPIFRGAQGYNVPVALVTNPVAVLQQAEVEKRSKIR